jgi:hypothetical protein
MHKSFSVFFLCVAVTILTEEPVLIKPVRRSLPLVHLTLNLSSFEQSPTGCWTHLNQSENKRIERKKLDTGTVIPLPSCHLEFGMKLQE